MKKFIENFCNNGKPMETFDYIMQLLVGFGFAFLLVLIISVL